MEKSACAAGGRVGTVTPAPNPEQCWMSGDGERQLSSTWMYDRSRGRDVYASGGRRFQTSRPTTTQNDSVISRRWRSLKPARRLPPYDREGGHWDRAAVVGVVPEADSRLTLKADDAFFLPVDGILFVFFDPPGAPGLADNLRRRKCMIVSRVSIAKMILKGKT